MSQPEIKFVTVEILKKSSSNSVSVECGLFKGIKLRSDGDTDKPKIVSYVLIEKQGEEDSIHAFNLDNFNILSIASRCDNIKELVICKANAKDQYKAFEILQDFLSMLIKDKRMVKNSPEIIDIKSYKDVPAGLKKPKSIYPVKNTYNSYCGHDNNNISNWKKEKEEKEEEEKRQEELRKIPTTFKRDSETPGVKALNLMKKKIATIASGDYESGALKELEENDDDNDVKKVASGFVAG
jgi:hypothetical protein